MPIAAAGDASPSRPGSEELRTARLSVCRLAGQPDLSGLGPALAPDAQRRHRRPADRRPRPLLRDPHPRREHRRPAARGDGSVFVTYHARKELPIDDRRAVELGMAMFCNEIRHHAEPGWGAGIGAVLPPGAGSILSLHRRASGRRCRSTRTATPCASRPRCWRGRWPRPTRRSRRMMTPCSPVAQLRTPEGRAVADRGRDPGDDAVLGMHRSARSRARSPPRRGPCSASSPRTAPPSRSCATRCAPTWR